MDQRPSPGDLCLDHVAHFVPDLQAAAAALEKLGYVVTPESAHRTQHGPAGTSNRCVMLEAGYIEILAPTMDTPNAQRVRERMKSFVGVHLCCFGTIAPAAEHARLAAHGFEPEPLVNLARNLQDGTPVKFNVVYAPPAKMPEGRIQYCEHLTETNMWRKEWVNPLRLDAVFVVAADPAETAARWARFTGVLPRRDGEFVELLLARGKVVIGSRAAMVRLLGEAPPPPALAGYTLSSGKPGEKPRAVKLPGALGGVWLMR